MKTISKIIFITCACSALFYSCDDILEDDITDDVVQLTYPLNDEIIESNVANFQWTELDGADKYRVQVFTPNQNMVVDSLVAQTSFTYSLNPGNYQWRVRGENFAYTSAYSYTASFSMVASDDLTNQQVVLSNPSTNIYTNNASITFNWESLAAADTYTFQLINISDGETLYNEQTGLTSNSVTLNSTVISEDGQYQWKVKAVNTEGSTPFSSRTFFLDKTVPGAPVNSQPATNTIQDINEQLNFSWNAPVDNGVVQSAVTYTIEFSTEVSFTSIFAQQTNLSTTTFQQTFTIAGDYYWRVRAKDAAGNTGSNSTPFKITVN